MTATGDERFTRLAPPRVGPFREDAFQSPLHATRTAAWLGVALGVCFVVCFLTGFLSHLIQHPPSWFDWPSRPAGLYRLSQGIHVTTGIASIPLLLAKLWTVYPRLWTWPPIRSAAHAIERISLLPLVGGSLFLLFTGVASISRWFPWGFSFPPAHHAVAWITIGGLVVHLGAKIGATRLALSSRSPDVAVDAVARRARLGWPVQARVPRSRCRRIGSARRRDGRPDVPPAGRPRRARPARSSRRTAGRPVNKTAGKAGVTEAATDPSYRLVVDGAVTSRLSLTLDDLRVAATARRDAADLLCRRLERERGVARRPGT